ncbi:hypothetical protein [Bradyrhizobium sp. UFLA05-112]
MMRLMRLDNGRAGASGQPAKAAFHKGFEASQVANQDQNVKISSSTRGMIFGRCVGIYQQQTKLWALVGQGS